MSQHTNERPVSNVNRCPHGCAHILISRQSYHYAMVRVATRVVEYAQVTLLREHCQGPNAMLYTLPTGGYDHRPSSPRRCSSQNDPLVCAAHAAALRVLVSSMTRQQLLPLLTMSDKPVPVPVMKVGGWTTEAHFPAIMTPITLDAGPPRST